MQNQFFLKVLILIIISAFIFGGGILVYQYGQKSKEEIKIPKKEATVTPKEEKGITFGMTFGGEGNDYGNSIIQASDGSYIIIGNKEKLERFTDCLFIKVNSNGNKEWEETFSGNDYGYACSSVLQVSDGGYIIVGTADFITGVPIETHSKILLIKTNSNGEKEWEKTIETKKQTSEGALSIIQADDGYIIESRGQLGEFILIKIDLEGNIKWRRDFNFRFGILSSVTQTLDSGYVLIGTNWGLIGTRWEGYPHNHSNARLIKIDSNGNKEWDKVFIVDKKIFGIEEDKDSTYGSDGISVTLSSDGGFVITGGIWHSGTQHKAWVMKTDAKGDREWEKTFSFDDNTISQGNFIAQTLDSGYIIVGYTQGDGLVVKIDSEGNEQWHRIFGGDNNDEFRTVIRAPNGGYYLLGNTESFGAGGKDIWLIETDSLGNTQK